MSNIIFDVNGFSKILDTVVRGYISAIYFAETGDNEQPAADDEMARETVIRCFSDCADFLGYCENAGLLAELENSGRGYSWDSFGIDFWFTRCGHGCGFWDRGLGDIGDKLTAASKTFGNVDVYLGADNLIYFY